jgi:hypothetical protein
MVWPCVRLSVTFRGVCPLPLPAGAHKKPVSPNTRRVVDLTPRRLEQYPDSLGKTALSELPAVDSAALTEIIRAWPDLPEVAKDATLEIVRAAKEAIR